MNRIVIFWAMTCMLLVGCQTTTETGSASSTSEPSMRFTSNQQVRATLVAHDASCRDQYRSSRQAGNLIGSVVGRNSRGLLGGLADQAARTELNNCRADYARIREIARSQGYDADPRNERTRTNPTSGGGMLAPWIGSGGGNIAPITPQSTGNRPSGFSSSCDPSNPHTALRADCMSI